MDWSKRKEELRAEARRAGFAAAGITSMAPFVKEGERALRAIDEGRMQGMPWYSHARVRAATDLQPRYPWAQSILALAWPYPPAAQAGEVVETQATPGRPRGRISAYACVSDEGTTVDYHELLTQRCADLASWLRQRHPDLRTKHFVDHGWAMDRAIAERAGIGFTGKNTTLITREAGSYVLLAEMLLSLPLPADEPSRKACGTCRACIPSCPTDAIIAPGVIDAPRCISYLTIEHRGSIPVHLRALIGTWAFGCDLCQEACPINARLAPAAMRPDRGTTSNGPVPFPDLVECLELTDAEFAARFKATTVSRTGRAGLARNCAVALGNSGDAAAIPALRRAREDDPDPVVREAAAWAMSRLST